MVASYISNLNPESFAFVTESVAEKRTVEEVLVAECLLDASVGY